MAELIEFIPNTKAKASEVNYNFNLLKDKIENVVTDLNGKADKTQWVASVLPLIDGSKTDIGTQTFDLTDYLPNDNSNYEVHVMLYIARKADTGGTNSFCGVTSSFYPTFTDPSSELWYPINIEVDGTNWQQGNTNGNIIVTNDRTLTFSCRQYATTNTRLILWAYRRID